MAREQLANALTVIGKGAGAIASSRMEREAKEIDFAREESIAKLQHGYRMDEQLQAQTADMTIYAANQANEDRRAGDRSKHELALEDRRTANDVKLAGERAKHEEKLAGERYRRDDIERLEQSHVTYNRRIDDRIRALTDDLNKEEYMQGMPGHAAVLDELDQLERQKTELEADYMLQMRDLGAPGYKERVEALLTSRKPPSADPAAAAPG